MQNKHLFGVILAGGGGTRLWPKSRENTPKQFLKLTSKRTMMQVSADRLIKMVPWERIIVVTNQKYFKDVRSQLPEVPIDNIIQEPEKKDTALAMLVGSLLALSKDKEAVILNGASDHTVTDENEFVRVMQSASQVAQKGEYIVTVGITPTFATNAFGYIKVSQELQCLDRELSLFKVDKFTEKPNVALARAYIATGKYFWNANMYVWKASVIKAAFKKYMPSLYKLCQDLDTFGSKKFHASLGQIYSKATSISIDYAISEKADNLVLIPGNFGWNDVGDWKVVYDLGKKDLAGNVIIGESEQMRSLAIRSHGNLIHTNDRLIAMIDVNEMVVVDSEEILLICPKEKSQEVKKIVERLKEENKKEYL